MLEFMRNQIGYPNKAINYDAPIKSINIGDGHKDYTVHYDENGFPEFEDFCPDKQYAYTSQTLYGDVGSSKDIKDANKAMEALFEGRNSDNFVWDGNSNNFTIRKTDSNGKLYEVLYTWHHHQDGRTMFPVPTLIHNSRNGGFRHSGGGKAIFHELQDFFNPPKLK